MILKIIFLSVTSKIASCSKKRIYPDLIIMSDGMLGKSTMMMIMMIIFVRMICISAFDMRNSSSVAMVEEMKAMTSLKWR
jgi:hypothetical protein